MIWLIMLYFIILDAPHGVVETSFANGFLTVGDETFWTGADTMDCVRKRQGKLIFTFTESPREIISF